jgi:HPt (histidine-containing phosphotransfer) domain-containing protein
MSIYYATPLVNDAELAQARASLGTGLARILGYFREDGAKSILQIEEALAAQNPAALVIPAHTLKGESRQFGARRLAELAEVIEMTARRCVEQHSDPAEIAGEVAMLRGCFVDTLALLEAATSATPRPVPTSFSPAPPRPASFGHAPRTFGRRTG